MPSRSYKRLTINDLRHLGKLAAIDRNDLFQRKIYTGQLYSDRLFAVALCQGAALHYLDGKNGIKDFDVWSFYRANAERPFPYRRRGIADFGDPKFGVSDDMPEYIGRRVDFMGRSITSNSFRDPIIVLQTYFREGKTKSARLLAQKAVVIIEPSHLLGKIVWPQE